MIAQYPLFLCGRQAAMISFSAMAEQLFTTLDWRGK
jgi:hypothetical protein